MKKLIRKPRAIIVAAAVVAIAVGVLILVVGGPNPFECPPVQAACKAASPNVLLFITDDQPAAYSMAVMPRTRAEFQNRGTRFDQAYVTTPLCCPSRSSIYSGEYAHNHGVVANDGTLLDPAHTWEKYLHAAGYRTAIFGKYLNEVSANVAPYFDIRRAVAPRDTEDPRVLSQLARDFLAGTESNDGQPWALVVATFSPHAPFTVQPEVPQALPPVPDIPGSHEPDLSDKHPQVAVTAARFDARAGFAEEVRTGQLTELEATDEMVGEIMDALYAQQERARTLGIFISDNGYLWGQHRIFNKQWPYLESVHVPLFMSWPGHIAERSVDNRLVANIDIAPTIYTAAAITPNYTVDGESLLVDQSRSNLLLESPRIDDPEHPQWDAYLSKTRQYIRWENGFVEDYDLTSDPTERHASNAHSAQIDGWLDKALTCRGISCP